MRKYFLLVSIFAILFLGVAVLFAFWYEESQDKIVNKWWQVKKITINEEDVTEKFKRLRLIFSYSKRFPMTLPVYKEKDSIKFKEKDNWQYYRTDFFEGNVKIYDYRQEIFTGDYQIEVLDHRTPQWIKLYSDSRANEKSFS